MNLRFATTLLSVALVLLCAEPAWAQAKGCGRRVDCQRPKPTPSPDPTPATAPAPEPAAVEVPVVVTPTLTAIPDETPTEAALEAEVGLDANLFARWKPYDRATLWTQAFSGTVATMAGAALGSYAGCAIAGGDTDMLAVLDKRYEDADLSSVLDCVQSARVGGYVGAVGSGLITINVAGAIGGGTGSFWASLLGSLIGAGPPAAYLFLTEGDPESPGSSDMRFMSLFIGPALGTAFGIVGYHMGGSPDYEARDVEPSTWLVVPSRSGVAAFTRF